MIKIYLAARYTRRLELCEYRQQLEQAGFTVTSRWLNGDHQVSDAGLGDPVDGTSQHETKDRQRFAMEDWEDLRAAHICINFTEAPRSSNSRGGRHVEYGAALAFGQICMVVGPRENVFHCLPNVEVFDIFDQCLERLTRVERPD